jgi:sodium/bile acid cotransporter 7
MAPILAWFAAPALLPDPFQVGLLVVAAVPCTLGSAAVWTRLAGGNEAIALMTTFVTNSFVFVGTVGILALLTGLTITLEPTGVILQLLLFVVAPIIVAQTFRLLPPVSKTMDEFKGLVGVATQLCILLIIVKSAVAASTKLGEAQEIGMSWSATELLQVGLVCAGMHLALLTTGFFLGDWLFSPESARAIAIAGSQKTLPVAALIIDRFFPDHPLAIVPVLFYHVLQLILDTFFAERVRLLVRNHPDVTETDLTAAET